MSLSNPIATGCPFCGTGCALSITCNGTTFKVKGDKSNPSTQGDLCFKPIQMATALDTNRLTTPLYRVTKTEPFKEISWDEAISILASRIQSLPKEELYLYLSGQLLSEESYLFTKLMKGCIGTNNVDANSRLCMASAVVAHKMAFGSDGPIGSYKDIDNADAIVITGANLAWAHPIVFRRIMARKKAFPDTQIIVIDPIWTETAQKADVWLGLTGGSDTLLYNAVLNELDRRNACDTEFIRRATEGFYSTLESAQKIPYEEAIEACGLALKDVERLTDLFASNKKIVGLWCQGLNQAVDGVMRNLAFINLFLSTGRMNAIKGSPFSLTGQPNAMGGREAGYLSNALPGYRDVRNPTDREVCERHWNRPTGSIDAEVGITITEAIDTILDNHIHLLWVACTNPLITLPDVDKTAQAFLQEHLFLVVQDCVMSETAQLANLVLPTASWGEKEGSMTNSERYVKRFRPFKEIPDGVKSDIDIICDVATALGYPGFTYNGVDEIYDEYKVLTSGRLCDQSTQDYDTLSYQWGGSRLYEDEIFLTHSKKAQFHPIPTAIPEPLNEEFILITGRTKKQWHTMTRTGNVPELLQNEEAPYLLINPDEAAHIGLTEGDIVQVTSTLGSLDLKIRYGKLAPHHLFSPFGYPLSPINKIIPTLNDPFSSQSAFKSTRVTLTAKH